jgi:heme-degrading monooxygenase HmoA
MHGLFFDVRPKPGHMVHYFAHVDRLKPALEGHRGLIYLERFRPLDDAEALLSHQLWADEAALAGWRRDSGHRASQSAGRRVHFESYRIRVGRQIVALPEAAMPAPAEAVQPGRYLVAAYGAAPVQEGRAFESVTNPGRFLTLAEAQDDATATDLAARSLAGGAERVRLFLIDRDYGPSDRAEAPGD